MTVPRDRARLDRAALEPKKLELYFKARVLESSNQEYLISTNIYLFLFNLNFVIFYLIIYNLQIMTAIFHYYLDTWSYLKFKWFPSPTHQ